MPAIIIWLPLRIIKIQKKPSGAQSSIWPVQRCLRQNDQTIGLIELYERGLDEQSGLLKTKEVGFLLDQAFEGHGYMTEALRLILNYAFKKKRQKEIWAGTFVNNEKSQKLLEKLGFQYVYTVDYSQISTLFSYQEKYYLLKQAEWLKIDANMKS